MPPKWVATTAASAPKKQRKEDESKSLRPERCKTCKLNGPPMRVRSIVTVQLKNLKKSADEGCPACLILHRGIRKVLNQSADIENDVRDTIREVNLEFSDTTSPKGFSLTIENPPLQISVFSWAGKSAASPIMLNQRTERY